MKLLTRNERQYRRAKLEQILIEEGEEYCFEYKYDDKYDDDGNLLFLYYQYNDDGTRVTVDGIIVEPIIVKVDSEGYLLDDNGEQITQVLDDDGNPFPKIDARGEAVVIKDKRKTKIYTTFRYNMVDQASIDKNQYISNIWNQDATFTIKTYDPIDPVITDRVIVQDKVYTITNIYKDFDDSTASMFNDGGYYVTYLGLKGAVSL